MVMEKEIECICCQGITFLSRIVEGESVAFTRIWLSVLLVPIHHQVKYTKVDVIFACEVAIAGFHLYDINSYLSESFWLR